MSTPVTIQIFRSGELRQIGARVLESATGDVLPDQPQFRLSLGDLTHATQIDEEHAILACFRRLHFVGGDGSKQRCYGVFTAPEDDTVDDGYSDAVEDLWLGGVGPPVSIWARHSVAWKYFSGFLGFTAPLSGYGGAGTMSPFLNHPRAGEEYAWTAAFLTRYGRRTDFVAWWTGYYGVYYNGTFTVNSWLAGSGDCAQTDCPAVTDPGYFRPSCNPDLSPLRGGYIYSPDVYVLNPGGAAEAGWTDTHAFFPLNDNGDGLSASVDSTFSEPVDFAARVDAVKTALLAHSWPAVWTSSPWSMTFDDAPQMRGVNMDVTGLVPSSYDGLPVVVNATPAPQPTWADCISGWSIDVYHLGISLFRGQVQNQSEHATTYFIGRCLGCDSDGYWEASLGRKFMLVSSGHTLAAHGHVGDAVECPFTDGLPFPLGSSGTYPILQDYCFIVVGLTAAAWAAANGLTFEDP